MLLAISRGCSGGCGWVELLILRLLEKDLGRLQLLLMVIPQYFLSAITTTLLMLLIIILLLIILMLLLEN